MMSRAQAGACVALLASLCLGCVDRRFIFESNVPNAQVYVDHKPIGAAPVDAPFDYYGYYDVTLVHPDYAPVHKRIRVRPPWYAYPPFDFFAEVVWPFRIEDTRRYFIPMEQALSSSASEVAERADLLRQRGWSLPLPRVAEAEPTPSPAPAPSPGPAPAPTPVPSVLP